MSKNICIVCINVAFANASALQNVLDCEIAYELNEPKGYGKLLTKEPHNINNIPKCEHYIFAGSGILSRIDVTKLQGRKTVLITDSHYLEDTKIIDKIIEDNNIEVFCMADLWKFCKFEKKLFIHPFKKIDIEIQKNTNFTICHSPYIKYNTNQKGSIQIQKAIDRFKKHYECVYDCVIDKTWADSLKIKAKSHFFIDQISVGNHYKQINYVGGIGKSGLEAMLLKSLTFTSGEKISSNIEVAPYIKVNSQDELYDKLLYYKKNTKIAKEIVERQYRWAIKYTNPNYLANEIIQNG